MKKKLVISILLIIVFVGVVIYFLLFNINSKGKFSYSSCIGGMSQFGPADYIEEALWKNNELTIKSKVNENCCVKAIKGDYTIEADNLILDITGKYGLVLCSCLCDYDTKIRINDIEKKDYKIILRINDKETDNLLLKTNNNVSDYCGENITYQCYKSKGFYYTSPPKPQENISVEFRFTKQEYKDISDKYPKFLEYFKRYEIYTYRPEFYDLYEFGFSDRNSINLKSTKKGQGGSSEGGLISGDSFEDAVKKYITEKETQYGPGSFAEQLQERLGLNITYVAPNHCCFRFIYGNETLGYSSDIKFIDRNEYLNLRFKDSVPEAEVITFGELKELIEVANKTYKFLEENRKINTDDHDLYVYINKETKKAKFEAYVSIDETEAAKNIIVHNHELPLTNPVQKKYVLDIDTGKLEENPDIWRPEFEY